MSALCTTDSMLNRFSRLKESGRLAHAYLFVGPPGVGKQTGALELAKLVNCLSAPSPSEYCGACPVCRKIDSGNHPDVVVLEAAEGETIKVAQVRELIQRTQMRPFEAKYKVFIIRDIENLTLEGGNALLKTLEEPSPNSLLILTTAVPERNLSTITSRCHVVHFFPGGARKVAGQLGADGEIDEDIAHFLACYAEGCLGQAREFSEQNLFERKNEIIDNIVLQRNNETYIKALLADKEATRQALKVFLTWFRDILLLKAGIGEEGLIHRDRQQDLRRLSSRYSYQQLREILREVVGACQMLKDNLNVKIPFALLAERIWVKS